MTVFEALMAGRLPASWVYQDEHCVAFMDINPITPGHVLVVPRQPVARLAELAPADRARLWALGQDIAAAQRRALGSIAQHFLVNDGPGASQTVPHVHLHVIPRYRGDHWRAGARLLWHVGTLLLPRREAWIDRARLDAQAAAIAAAHSNRG